MKLIKLNVGALLVIVKIKNGLKVIYEGFVKRKTFAWPSWSAFLDQIDEKTASIKEASVKMISANVFEFV